MFTNLIKWTDKITGLGVSYNNGDSITIPVEIINNIGEFNIYFSETEYGESHPAYFLEVYKSQDSYNLVLWDNHSWTENEDELIDIAVSADKLQLAINRIYAMIWDNFSPYLMQSELIHTLER